MPGLQFHLIHRDRLLDHLQAGEERLLLESSQKLKDCTRQDSERLATLQYMYYISLYHLLFGTKYIIRMGPTLELLWRLSIPYRTYLVIRPSWS